MILVGIGGNLASIRYGPPRNTLSAALAELEADGVTIRRRSGWYRSEPVPRSDQPWFLNQVVEVETSLFPKQLLARLQKIEIGMGRIRILAKGPRTVDIDILFYGNAIVSTPGLEIPHPRVADRRFVLEPLAEIAPDLKDPATGSPISALLSRLTVS